MNCEIQRESAEWCRMWWGDANVADRRRILLIGDSITNGYSDTVITTLKERFTVDFLVTSRSINDPGFRKLIAHMLEEHEYELVHFNNGLHGFHLADEAYRWHLQEWVRYLKWEAPTARLVWAQSTPVATKEDRSVFHPETNPIVLRRNCIAAEVMAEMGGIPVNDLYSVAVNRLDLLSADGVHYTEEGCARLGHAVVAAIVDRMD